MSFGFLGIQFGFALQGGFMSRIFQTLGAEKEAIPMLWIAAPLTGLLVQPIIGYLSDRTWHPVLGRRKPYFLIGAIFASITLVLMPYSSAVWMAAGMLWILDASINISMEPTRAFIADILPEKQLSRGYTMQSFFIGIGAVLAALMPWFLLNVIGMEKISSDGSIPDYVKVSFLVGGVSFLAAMLYTIFTTKEYPPEFYDDNQHEESLGYLEGLKIALKNIDKIVETIKKSKDPITARQSLMEGFGLSEIQSQAILDMRLQRLTGLETDKIISEYKDIIQHIAELKGILESESKRMSIIKEELLEIKEKYGEERRTEIIEDFTNLSIEDMIAEEEMVLTITHNGYIKRTSLSTYRSQRRGGRGVQGASSREEDFVEHLFVANTHSYILFFTDKGKCYWVKVYDIPEGGRAAKGRAIVNLIGCEPDEKVSAFISVKEFNDDHYVVMATEKGMVKKTKLSAYSNPRKKGIYAVEIRDGDKLIEARVSTGDNDILLGTRNGKSIRFSEEQIRASGRKTMGVKGITLSSEDDRLVGMLLIKREGTVLVATEKGFGKRTEISQYRAQKRGGKGVLTMKTTDKVGKMVTIKEVVDKDDLMIITNQGVLIRLPVAQIRSIGRATQGVKLIKLGEGTLVSSITRIMSEEEEDENNNTESTETKE